MSVSHSRAPARIVGSMQATDDVPARIGNVLVRLLEEVAAGVSEVVIVGSCVDGVLVADRVRATRRAAWPGRVRRVQIEGYIKPADSRAEVQVGGWLVDVPAADRDSWVHMPPDRQVQLKGVLDGSGRLIPDRVVFPGLPPRDRSLSPMDPGASGNEGAAPPMGANPPPARAGHPSEPHALVGPPRGPKQSLAQPPPGLQRPRAARPPLAERPRRPDIPRAPRRPPPPRGGRPTPMR